MRLSHKTGILYVVATPIGNLGDITKRALEVLTDVALVAAEDTRHTQRLLSHYGVSAKLCSCHEHNEAAVAPRVLDLLARGADVALVSDAGTPLISDPGFSLVRSARQRGFRVVPVPGPSAVVCALSAAGLPSDRFLFLGFPPRSPGKRHEWLAALAAEPGTLVLYEAANRLLRTLEDLGSILGPRRRVVVARELTKRFETFLCSTLEELPRSIVQDSDQQRGEVVVLVEGNRESGSAVQLAEEERVVRILAAELPLKQAAALAARVTGGNKNRLYKVALSAKDETEKR